MELPEELKFVRSIIARGKEVSTAEPIISYFCKLHAVQEILAKGVHERDANAAATADQLLNEIEAMKASNPTLLSEQGQSIINDDDLASAYVESFATKVFLKADKDIQNKTTTRATANDLLASCVFFDLLKIFKTALDPDVAAKIKYAKYHTARILKAYKNGEDPNDYTAPEEEIDLDGLSIERGQDSTEVVDLTKESETAEPADSPALESADFSLPAAPSALPKAPSDFSLPSASKPDFSLPSAPKLAPSQPTANYNETNPSSHWAPSLPPKVPPPQLTKSAVKTIMNDSEVITQAQKHAKFAISALNYEDKATAIRELQSALSLLGQ